MTKILIYNDDQYQKYLNEVHTLMAQDPDIDTPCGERLILLALAIKKYEKKHFFFGKPTLDIAIRFCYCLVVIICIYTIIGIVTLVHADTLNPCEYMNVNSERMNQLDTGVDENFERIKQQNNREMVMNCQEYEISRIRAARSDLGRDNY